MTLQKNIYCLKEARPIILRRLLDRKLLGNLEGRRRLRLRRDRDGRLLLVLICRSIGRSSRCGRSESLLVIHLLVIIVECGELVGRRGRSGSRLLGSRRSNRCILGIHLTLLIEEGRLPAERVRDLVRANLDGLPAETVLATREPDTRALDERCEDRALDDDVLERNVVERALVLIVDVGLELVIALAELDLQRRRIRLAVTLRVDREAHHRRIQLRENIAALGALEPRGRVLDTLVNHELVERVEGVVDGRRLGVVRRVIVAAELEVDRELGRALLVEDRETKGRLKRANLHDEGRAVIVEIRLLAARLKGLDGREGDIGRLEGGGCNNRRHLEHWLYLYAGRRANQFWRRQPADFYSCSVE